eukprot:CAMPEP_0197574988 /NCGR_PEP_ID=MMETSP1326-20131121/543_1 /TAXON_ID=1155430 /ORGANISM="Genus nov. species nov., Strain RCC2288" /LENGTH=318 /DNA_ID=CAMNT_0043137669 /DNA_START=50 /DNA_END=1006 /DNA_ORIENTATION=-
MASIAAAAQLSSRAAIAGPRRAALTRRTNRGISSSSSSASASSASTTTATAALLTDPELSILSAAVERAGLADALTSGKALTVFAPTDAAFAQVCEDLQLSKEEVLARENLAAILTYHVVDGTVTSKDLKDGAVPTLNERFMLDIKGTTVNSAAITAADITVGNLTVHKIDQVLFPPWAAPAKVQTPQQVLAFEGWAPEVVNGRLAMLGFLTCLVQEVATGHSFTQQFGENFGIFAAQVQLWAFASLAPSFSSNEGYTANPFTMSASRTWREVFKGSPWGPEQQAVFNPQTEQLNGRAAMVGIASLIVVETVMGHALF